MKCAVYTSGNPVTAAMRGHFAERTAFLPKPYWKREVVDAVIALLKPAPTLQH